MKPEKSWKTTLLGVMILLGVISAVSVPMLDGDAATNVNWEWVTANVTEALILFGIGVPAGLGFLFAKDEDK